MPYTQNTFAAVKQSVANRLDDSSKIFWTDTEIGILVQDALRFWNCLTGDFRVWYDLTTFAPGYGVGGYGLGGYGVGLFGVWYDLQTIAGSPRFCSLTDADIYQRLQFALLEPPLANAGLGTAQFQTADLVNAVQRARDEFIFRTYCTSSIETLSVTPNTETVTLPQSVIEVKRGYWLPDAQASPTNPMPLMRTDEAQQLGYRYLSPVTNSTDPETFSAGVEPPLTIDLYPPPGFPGQVELITYETQPALSATSPTTLLLPQDFAMALFWGALADLLDMNMVARDQRRAQYARMRFEQYIELMKVFPFVLAARNQGIPMSVDAVEVLDSYEPTWRTVSNTPSVVGLSGQNLVALPVSQDQFFPLFMVTNAPVPVLDTDFIQVGDEILDAIVDYAAHVGMFKQGWSETSSSMPLLQSIMNLAQCRNAKLMALSSYKEFMYGKAGRENQAAPQEVEANG